ncbi:MAG: glycerate 2-kinase [Acidobacteriota bacterium]|nr:glycerate 2-kinase [Acidobacteriota bacterium]
MTTPHADLRQLARRIFDEALEDADAGRAVRRAISLDNASLKIFDAEFDARTLDVYAVALGKAAAPMAVALDEILGARLLREGVITAPPLKSTLPARWRVFAGGHPLPNEASLEAARAAFALLRRANERATVEGARRALIIFLVSGGGSAMIESPHDPSITHEDLRVMNHALVTCGASITEINVVRRAVSSVKGGGLARAAPRASQATLIISDVGTGEEHTVASGPTFPFDEERDGGAARRVVERYDLAARLPRTILRTLARTDDDDQEELSVCESEMNAQVEESVLRRRFVLLDNSRAVERAAKTARAEGFAVEITRDITDQNVAEGARLLVSRLLELRERVGESRGACVISGGEFACPVRGVGVGGRNSETALRCALELDARAHASRADPNDSSNSNETSKDAPRFVALFAGTDGIDGNSNAAGALCDETTITRAHALNLDARAFLERSDSHTFFDALGDALITGATGTNVRDLRILMAK